MNSPVAKESIPIRVLLFEENDADVAAVRERLKRDNLPARVEVVARIEAFSAACERGGWSVALVTVRPGLHEGWRALELARAVCPATPLVAMAAGAQEGLIVACLRQGSVGFIAKERLERLPAVLRRAVEGVSAQSGTATPTVDLVQQRQYQLIAEHSRDLICLHALDFSITFVSPAIRTLLGYEPYECVGRQPRDIVHPDDVERVRRELTPFAAPPVRSIPFLLRVRHVDGRYVWMETLVEPIVDVDGRVVQLMSVSRDFSERQQVEETMRRGERLFEGIAEANRLLLTTRRVVDVLPAVLRALGEAADADRALVFEFRHPVRPGHPVGALRAEWAGEPASSVFGDPRVAELAAHDGASMLLRLAAGEVVEVSIDSLAGAEQAFWREHGLCSTLAFPVVVARNVWGFINFDQCSHVRTWSAGERSALRTAAANLGQAFDRENTLAALGHSERRYEVLLAGLSEGVFQIDLEARWRFLNPAWQEMTGHLVAQCLGRRFSDFVASEDATGALEGFGRLLSGRDRSVENEVRFRHRNGGDVWLRITARPQADETGRVVGVSGTLVDVTQRRQAQLALGASERKFATVFASSSDALLLIDHDTGLITECNPRAVEMFECGDPTGLVGTPSAGLQKEPMPPAEVERMRALLERGEDWSRELECVTRKARVFWGQVAVVRLAPEVVGTTLMRITDITVMKRAEEGLRASLAEKEVLLKEVYHRVKNNLQIISALLRMQTRRVRDRHALEALENSISRVMAMSMVHEKLYQAQNLVSIDFLSFAQSLVGFLNQLTVGGRAEIAIEVAGSPLALSIDQAIPLGLVLNELVTNSLKYAFPEGRAGHVTIRIGIEGGHTARVIVADDGVGLKPGVDLENADGLGLRIVRLLVEQLQGSLEIEKRGGLRVVVRMPLPGGPENDPGRETP